MTMSLFAQRVIFISSVLSGISGAIYMDHLSFKKLSYIESRISILKKDVEKIEKEEESTKEQVKKQNNKLNKKSKIINYVDDSIDIKNVDKSKKKNK
jgi:outer membrane murein-binding lipoprotein Lpp